MSRITVKAGYCGSPGPQFYLEYCPKTYGSDGPRIPRALPKPNAWPSRVANQLEKRLRARLKKMKRLKNMRRRLNKRKGK